MTNRVNCWEPLRAMTTTTYASNGDRESVKSVMDWAISSQASLRRVEGSTTNANCLYRDYEATRVRDDQNLYLLLVDIAIKQYVQIGRRYSLGLVRKAKKWGIKSLHGNIRNAIWDISKIPLPFTDAVGSETSKNPYKEWTTDALAAPNLTNAVIDGSDASGNNTVLGLRVGNHHQISTKVVRTSFRADESDVIGRTKELSYQMMRRQQELRRDVEAIVLTNQASFADTGSAAGKAGGLPTWLTTNFSAGATGAVGGFQSSGVTALRTYGTSRALTETLVRDAVQSVYTQGGDPSIMMSVPGTIRKFSEYLFTSSARVATLMSDQGKDASAATALGSVNVFVTDFGTLKLVPNRLQTPYVGTPGSTTGVYSSAGTSSDVFIIDPSYLAMTYMKGYRTEELAKTGLAENRQMSVDWSLICNTEKSHAIIGDITIASAVTA